MLPADDEKKRTALLRGIRIVFFDFDGVFTDNRVIVCQDGRESVVCCRSDGIGLARLNGAGVESVVISAETNPVVRARAKKLGIECFSGCSCKKDLVTEILQSRGIEAEKAAFVGNDTPDIDSMRCVGVGIAVQDAYGEVKETADLVTTRQGGFGAVREVCDWIVEACKSV